MLFTLLTEISKALDEKIKVALSPLSRIQQERKLHEDEMNESIQKSQLQYQELRRSGDFLAKANRAVESCAFYFDLKFLLQLLMAIVL